MEKEFIPYEQALALKELGFNEECFGMYQKNKKIWYCNKNNWITNFEIYPDAEILNFHIEEYPKNVSLINGIYFLHSCDNFTAPTFSQVFRWFRENHGLYHYILPEFYKNGINFNWQILWYLPKEEWTNHRIYNGTMLYGDNGEYSTQEKAELACLKKLIEIAKSK